VGNPKIAPGFCTPAASTVHPGLVGVPERYTARSDWLKPFRLGRRAFVVLPTTAPSGFKSIEFSSSSSLGGSNQLPWQCRTESSPPSKCFLRCFCAGAVSSSNCSFATYDAIPTPQRFDLAIAARAARSPVTLILFRHTALIGNISSLYDHSGLLSTSRTHIVSAPPTVSESTPLGSDSRWTQQLNSVARQRCNG